QQLQSSWAFLFLQNLPLPPLTVSLPILPAPFLLLFHTSTPKTTFPYPSITQISIFPSFLKKCHFLCATPNLTSMRCNTSSHMIELIQFIKELQRTWISHLNNFLKQTNAAFIFIFIGLVFRQICMMSFTQRELLRCGRHIRRWMPLRGIRERSL